MSITVRLEFRCPADFVPSSCQRQTFLIPREAWEIAKSLSQPSQSSKKRVTKMGENQWCTGNGAGGFGLPMVGILGLTDFSTMSLADC